MDGWRQEISSALLLRDRHERDCFAEIIETNNRLKSLADMLAERNMELEDNLQRSRQQLLELQRSPVIPQHNLVPFNSLQASPLSTCEYDSSKASSVEMARLYKSQAESAQKLLELTERLNEKKEELARKEEAVITLGSQLRMANQKSDDLALLVNEKNSAIQMLQDEVGALQLELSKLEERYRLLQEENSVLVERWLRRMNEEADKMNQANQFYEKMVEQQQQQQQRKPSSTFAPSSSSSAAASAMDRTILMMGDAALGESVIKANIRARVGLKEAKVPRKVQQIIRLNDSTEICALSHSADGRLIASGGSDRTVRIHETSTGKLVKQLPGFLQQIMCVQFSGQSGEHLLASGNDNCIRVWNNIQTSTSNSTPTVTLTGHIGNVWSARFAPDNWKRITSGGQDRTIKVWDLQRGACVRTIFSYSSVNDLCLTDDAGVISGHSDHTVRYWDSKTGDCIKELSGIHAGQITSISVSPDAFQILTCSRDNTLKAIDIRTFKLLCTFENESFRTPANYSRACYSPDGRYVAAGSTNGQVFVWNAETGKIENVLLGVSASNPQLAVSWSPESQGFLVSCSKTDGSITLFE